MKKIISILLLVVMLIFTLSACGMGKPKIEDYEWKMQTIGHVEGEQVVYDAANEERSIHPKQRLLK